MDRSFWSEAVNNVLSILEDTFLDDASRTDTPNSLPTLESQKHTRHFTNESCSDMETPPSPIKRQRNESDENIDALVRHSSKARRLSKSLSNQFARSLSMAGSTITSEGSAGYSGNHHRSYWNCDSAATLSSNSSNSSLSSLSIRSHCTSGDSVGIQSDAPLQVRIHEPSTTTNNQILHQNRTLAYPTTGRSMRSREKNKLCLRTADRSLLHQSSRSSIDIDNYDARNINIRDNDIPILQVPITVDAFQELIQPVPPEYYVHGHQSIDDMIQKWVSQQASSFRDMTPESLMQELRLHLASLEYKLPQVLSQISRSGGQTPLQSDQIREFYKTACEVGVDGEWLLRYRFPLLSVIFPTLSGSVISLQEAIKLARISEDMYNTIQWTPVFSRNCSEMVQEFEELVGTKQALYEDYVSQDGLSWKAIGIPVDTLLFSYVRQWMETVSRQCLNQIAREYERRASSSTAFGNSEPSIDDLSKCANQLLHAVASATALCGSPFPGCAAPSLFITAEYTQWAADKLKPPGSSSVIGTHQARERHISYKGRFLDKRAIRTTQAYEGLVKQLGYVRAVLVGDRPIFDLNPQITDVESVLRSLETIAASLVEASWTLAEVLAAFRADGHFFNPSGTFLLYTEFVIRFARKAVEFGGKTQQFSFRLRQMHDLMHKFEIQVR